jgi:hypothetical protein
MVFRETCHDVAPSGGFFPFGKTMGKIDHGDGSSQGAPAGCKCGNRSIIWPTVIESVNATAASSCQKPIP